MGVTTLQKWRVGGNFQQNAEKDQTFYGIKINMKIKSWGGQNILCPLLQKRWGGRGHVPPVPHLVTSLSPPKIAGTPPKVLGCPPKVVSSHPKVACSPYKVAYSPPKVACSTPKLLVVPLKLPAVLLKVQAVSKNC